MAYVAGRRGRPGVAVAASTAVRAWRLCTAPCCILSLSPPASFSPLRHSSCLHSSRTCSASLHCLFFHLSALLPLLHRAVADRAHISVWHGNRMALTAATRSKSIEKNSITKRRHQRQAAQLSDNRWWRKTKQQRANMRVSADISKQSVNSGASGNGSDN